MSAVEKEELVQKAKLAEQSERFVFFTYFFTDSFVKRKSSLF